MTLRHRDLRTARLRHEAQRWSNADPVHYTEPEDGPEPPREWQCWLCGTEDEGGGCPHSKPWECPR